MSDKILLVTTIDETFQQPLLQSQGYDVQRTTIREAFDYLRNDDFQLALVTTESGVENTVTFCQDLKRTYPSMRVGIIAQRAEYLAPDDSVDSIIRMQHSPAKFLATVKKLFGQPSVEGSRPVNADEMEDGA